MASRIAPWFFWVPVVSFEMALNKQLPFPLMESQMWGVISGHLILATGSDSVSSDWLDHCRNNILTLDIHFGEGNGPQGSTVAPLLEPTHNKSSESDPSLQWGFRFEVVLACLGGCGIGLGGTEPACKTFHHNCLDCNNQHQMMHSLTQVH